MSREVFQTALAAEVEGVFVEPRSEDEWWARNRHFRLQGSGAVTGTPTPRQDIVPQMRAYYGALNPSTEAEEDRQRMWLEYVGDYITPTDVVNFQVYRALSRACLTYPTYPVGTTYTDLTKQAGTLEFRGPGVYQLGWYDSKDISEMRLAPTPAALFGTYRAALLRRVETIAAAEGHRFYLASEHDNGSIFLGETPLLQDELEPYIAAVAGLRRIFIEGGLLNPRTYPDAAEYVRFGPLRTHKLRIVPGRVECRGTEALDGPDYANMARFLRAGLIYGLRYSTDEEKTAVHTYPILQPTPLPGYDKVEHLHIKRAIQACLVDPSRCVDGQNYMMLDNGVWGDVVLSELLGREIIGMDEGYLGDDLFRYGLTLSSEGYLSTNEQLLAKVLQLHPRLRCLSYEDIPTINAKLRLFKVTPVRQIHEATPRLNSKRLLHNLRQAQALPLVALQEYEVLVNRLLEKPLTG